MTIWKDIEGWPGYMVSNEGDVASAKRGDPKILKLHTSNRGYALLTLHHDGGKKTHALHCLVAAAFIGPKPDGMTVNHKNCDKLDNDASNLEYLTPQENIRHAAKNGRLCCGEDSHASALKADQVRWIRANYKKREFGCSKIAKAFGVHETTIRRIIQGKTWKSIL